MTRIRSNTDVARAWIQQEKSYGSTAHMSFRDSQLFSYAACIGSIVKAKYGPQRDRSVALLSSRTWSVTTSKHQSIARSAAYNGHGIVASFTVPFCRPLSIDEHTANMLYLVSQADESIKKSKSARKTGYKVMHLDSARRYMLEANEYAAMFLTQPMPPFGKRQISSVIEAGHELKQEEADEANAVTLFDPPGYTVTYPEDYPEA